jgi:hypothetical protein
MNNFIKDKNPLDLAAPPAWWLKKLHEFDDSLVVVPSRMAYCYRLAQRRPPDKRTNLVHDLQGDNDSTMLRSYGLVPVTTIIATARWDNPIMFEDLASRMPSRNGGWEAYEKRLNELEEMKNLRERAERDDMLDHIAKDSLGFYKKKAGIKTAMWTPKTPARPEPAPAFGRSASIKIAGKYDTLEKHIKKPFSQR